MCARDGSIEATHHLASTRAALLKDVGLTGNAKHTLARGSSSKWSCPLHIALQDKLDSGRCRANLVRAIEIHAAGNES